jgi:hypothetical protein
MRVRALFALLAALAIAWIAPLAGLAARGEALRPYLHFPPRTQEVTHSGFSWPVFGMLAIPAFAAGALFFAASRAPSSRQRSRSFPWWGWLGLALVALGWILAWNADRMAAHLGRHAFTPLWLGYVLSVNGIVYRRSGESPLTHRTAWFVALFPASVAFWWLFEYLNQFVRNWYYSGVQAATDWEYVAQASLPFSTVLPAVASTWCLLKSWRFSLPALRGHRAFAWVALAAGALCLAATPVWPQALFPMLWIGPLLLLAGLQKLLLGETLFEPVARGDWSPVLQPAAAALVCGFFWELWNYGAAAKWHYSIPYVQRFHIFEMPLLGYAGYLPFGVLCAVAMDIVARLVEERRLYA